VLKAFGLSPYSSSRCGEQETDSLKNGSLVAQFSTMPYK
jgi:hypothetical protein